MDEMPTLFIGHGAPLLLSDPAWGGEKLRELGQRLPRPECILVISAHWLTAEPCLSDAELPETIHDFYGFPKEFYDLVYSATGAPGFAAKAQRCLERAGFPAKTAKRGLDHGAWVPLFLMFPEADIPVLQCSVQNMKSPAHHWALGEALRSLRQEGVLIMGSGLITHALGEIHPAHPEGKLVDWASEFTNWLLPKIESCDRDALLNYRTLAPNAARAHPTDEHLLPLFVAMGAAAPCRSVERVEMGALYGSILMDSYLFR